MATLSLSAHAASDAPAWQLSWKQLPPLPPAPGQARQAGVAGPYAGVHRDALLVAGGANFPDKRPWENGVKAWWDDIWVLTKDSAGGYVWVTDARFKLPRAMGYGMSFNTPDGVVCVGGADNDRCYDDVFMLAWDPAARTVTTTTLPTLPKPLAFMSGAMIGSTLYVAGGQLAVKEPQFGACFWALDLSRRGTANFGWEELPAWPGPARMLPIAAAQSNGRNECFYLFSGRLPKAGEPAALLADSYVYDPATKQWRTLAPPAGATDAGAAGACLMGATAVVEGNEEILLLGGDRGKLFSVLEAHDLQVARLRRELAAPGANQAALQEKIDAELQEKIKIYENHPGFVKEVLAYNTRTNTWRVVGQMPVSSPVTTLATKWGDSWVIPTGEEKPGIRTNNILQLKAMEMPAGGRGQSK